MLGSGMLGSEMLGSGMVGSVIVRSGMVRLSLSVALRRRAADGRIRASWQIKNS